MHRIMSQARWHENFDIFNENGGKFRVSLVNVCNLDCFFCHNEAMPNPRRGATTPAVLPIDELLRIISAYTDDVGQRTQDIILRDHTDRVLLVVDDGQTAVILRLDRLDELADGGVGVDGGHARGHHVLCTELGALRVERIRAES